MSLGASVKTGFIAFNFVLFLGLAIGLWARPNGQFVLVIAAPQTTAAQMMDIIGRAGGRYLSTGRFDWMVVAQSPEPDFARRLLQTGALLVLNHDLALGCAEKDNS